MMIIGPDNWNYDDEYDDMWGNKWDSGDDDDVWGDDDIDESDAWNGLDVEEEDWAERLRLRDKEIDPFDD